MQNATTTIPKGWELTGDVRVPTQDDRWLGTDHVGQGVVLPASENHWRKTEVIILRKVEPDTLTITIPYKLGLKLQDRSNWLRLASVTETHVAEELERAVKEAQDLL